MNEITYERYVRSKSDSIQVLIGRRKGDEIQFLVSGNSGTHYKIKMIGKDVTCSCPDFTYRKSTEVVCKHILYLLITHLKIFPTIHHAFFKRCYFTPDEMALLKKVKLK